MTSRDIILKNMEIKKVTVKILTEKLGYKYASGVSERLRGSDSMKIELLLKFLNILDCDLIVRQRESGEEWKLGDDEGSQTIANSYTENTNQPKGRKESK